MFENLKVDIEKLVIKGRTENAIELLINKIPSLNNSIISRIQLLSARYEKNKKDFQQQMITKEEERIEIQNINKAILELAKELNLEVSSSKSKKALADKIQTLNLFRKNLKGISDSSELINDALKLHKKELNAWCSIITFKDIKSSKVTDKIYVDLDYYVVPRRSHFSASEKLKVINLRKIWKECDTHLVILGEPGAGKTTTMKKIVMKNLVDEECGGDYKVPIVIRLRELNDTPKNQYGLVIKKMFSILGLNYSKLYNDETELAKDFIEKTYLDLTDELRILLILDGFDELRNDLKKACINEVSRIALLFKKSRIILTSRTADYKYSIDNTTEFEISPLNKQQVEKFIKKWIGNEEKANSLFKKINNSPYADSAMKPLSLAHICAIYERNLSIPDKPKTVYRKLLNLLLEEWDIQRDIKRESQYAKFEPDRKLEFLSYLSYFLTTSFEKSIFTDAELKKGYENIYENFGLPINEKSKVINEIESHTGIFIKSGYDNFEFAHKSTQEYLAAEYLVKLPYIPDSSTLIKIPNEVALAVAISSNPTIYLSQLVYNFFTDNYFSHLFLSSFINRLEIEKPDFYPNPELGISILYLYTLNEIRSRSRDSKVELDSIFKLGPVKESLKKVLKLYKEVKILSNLDIEDVKKYYDIERVFYHFSPSVSEEAGISLLKRNVDFVMSNRMNSPNVLFYPKDFEINK